jgi:hypothetical protein
MSEAVAELAGAVKLVNELLGGWVGNVELRDKHVDELLELGSFWVAGEARSDAAERKCNRHRSQARAQLELEVLAEKHEIALKAANLGWCALPGK